MIRGKRSPRAELRRQEIGSEIYGRALGGGRAACRDAETERATGRSSNLGLRQRPHLAQAFRLGHLEAHLKSHDNRDGQHGHYTAHRGRRDWRCCGRTRAHRAKLDQPPSSPRTPRGQPDERPFAAIATDSL